MSNSSNTEKLKVGIVDDSPLIRQLIQSVIEKEPNMEVVGTAENAIKAREMIKAVNPDVITLDIEMPGMNGIAFLEKIMTLRPMPVIMVSTLTTRGADITLQALEIGAIDYVPKPEKQSGSDELTTAFKNILIPKLKNVKNANIQSVKRVKTQDTNGQTKPVKTNSNYDLITIAASTGGVERLRYLIGNIRVNTPPIAIVQHINKMYTAQMAERMQKTAPSHITVKLARHNEKLKNNTVYIADNHTHLGIKQSGSNLYSYFIEKPSRNGFIASADYLFESVADFANNRVLGIILSGMGCDGAEGLLNLKNNGAITIGENKASCLVYGMSRAAAEAGAVTTETNLESILETLNKA